MAILITGGTGFIGPYVVRELVESEKDVVIFDVAPDPSAIEKMIPGKEMDRVKILRGNVLNLPEILSAVKQNNVRYIIHLVALRNVASQENPFDAFKLNCEGTINIFEVARQTGIKRVVYASSTAVYGSPDYYSNLGLDPDNLSEEAPVHPENFYGASKAFCEFMGEQYHKIYGLDNIGVRLPIVFGPGKKPGSKSSMFNEVIEKPALGEKYKIASLKNQRFTVQYVKDSAHALICACLAENPKHRVYNTGGEKCLIREMAECAGSLIPDASIEIVDVDIKVAPASAVDYSRAKEELGYEPRYSLKGGIKDHVNIIRKKVGLPLV